MKLLLTVRKLIEKANDGFKKKNLSIKEEINFLYSLGEMNDDFERSLNQYLCQRQKNKEILNFFNNIIAFPCLLPMIVYLIIKKTKNVSCSQKAIFWNQLGTDIIPDSLKTKYKPKKVEEITIGYLEFSDLKFFLEVTKKVGFRPFFLFKILIKLSTYRKYINEYKPEIIICTSEYSFTSSIITNYCERQKISHVNVMHGEKLLNIRDSCFRFSKCYVWDHHYINIFLQLLAYKNQFKIERPKSLRFDINKYKSKNVYDFKYYLGIIDKNNIYIIKKIIDNLIEKEYRVVLRPHPRYTNMKLLKEFFGDQIIEDSQKISIEESLAYTKNVIGLHTTVLQQAYTVGKNVYIDDISNKMFFNKLKERKYIMLAKKVYFISNYIEK